MYLLFLIIFLKSYGLFSEDLDYNYEYEKKSSYTKFSDWIPYKLHKWEPKFLEDYYQLYGLRLHYDINELRRNIFFLKLALKKRFRHPKNALCKITTEETYYKYRLLMFMQINLQIMRSYMRIASKYDKRHLYFYNLDFAYDLNRSFKISESFYKEAVPYWKKAKKYAMKASSLKSDLDLGMIESNRYQIEKEKLDFGKIIKNHLLKLEKKQETIQAYFEKYPEANNPNL